VEGCGEYGSLMAGLKKGSAQWSQSVTDDCSCSESILIRGAQDLENGISNYLIFAWRANLLASS
jgi:hypothetical protein